MSTTKPKAKATLSKKRPKPDLEDEDDDAGLEGALLHGNNSQLSITPPSAKRQKKLLPKKSGAVPLQEVENEALTLDGTSEPKPKKGSKSTEQYQKVK